MQRNASDESTRGNVIAVERPLEPKARSQERQIFKSPCQLRAWGTRVSEDHGIWSEADRSSVPTFASRRSQRFHYCAARVRRARFDAVMNRDELEAFAQGVDDEQTHTTKAEMYMGTMAIDGGLRGLSR